MIPDRLVDAHRGAQQSIETLAYRDLLAVWRSLDLADARRATGLLLPEVRNVTGAYGELAAVEAADFYDDARRASRRGGSSAVLASPAPAGQVDAMTRWAVTPLWAEDPRTGTALVRLAGGTQRLIQQANRDTIYESVAADGGSYTRQAAPGACDFCQMLAGRTYSSREAAGQVVGRERRDRHTNQIVGRRGQTRGTRQMGEQYHDHCRCQPVPAF